MDFEDIKKEKINQKNYAHPQVYSMSKRTK